MTVTHSPVVSEKTSTAHALDDGTVVDGHDLYRVDCSCGDRGLVWYASLGRALESWRRHLALVCECGHGLREHRAFRSLSPFMSRDCAVEGCGCVDFRQAGGDEVEERAA